MVSANKTVTSIVNDQQMVGSSIFDMLCHLHCEFNTGIRATGYTPRLGSIIEAFAEDLLELQKVLLVHSNHLPIVKEVPRHLYMGIDWLAHK